MKCVFSLTHLAAGNIPRFDFYAKLIYGINMPLLVPSAGGFFTRFGSPPSPQPSSPQPFAAFSACPD